MKENFANIIKPDSAEADLLDQLDAENLPRHIGIIMDGNGRWAKHRGKPRIFGHKAGAESVRAIVDTTARMQIEAVTLYAFSTENWKRPKTEVSGLMSMMKHYLKNEFKTIHKNNIRLRILGDMSALDGDIRRDLQAAIEKTSKNTGTNLSVALNYGGRAEIVRASRLAAKKLVESGRNIDELSEADIEAELYTAELPDLDLMIRTSGEFRISNFLLWQIAYAEIYVTPTLFPDFRRTHIFEAVLDYQNRSRRFGSV